jgi:hypothetical protein
MTPSTRQARPPAAAGVTATAAWMLEREARALMTRLAGVKPFAVQETMLPAAAITPAALVAIERVLITERAKLRRRVLGYIRWLREGGRSAEPSEMQRRFALLRVAFNDVLSQFDLFSDAITQRSEQEVGLWLSGLDVFAADALALPGYYEPPQVICHLDRGPGAAVRRARTRLPGNVLNPVAIVRVPRERMVGQGIASSLVHEVGHQAAALLDFVPAARVAIQESGRRAPQQDRKAWEYLDRCASEIVADLWSVATLGIGSTLGLIGVVSLPRYFVFAYHPEDPHPLPFSRVKISCALGDALYPHPQWREVAALWSSLYPAAGLDARRNELIASIDRVLPAFVKLIVTLPLPRLRGRSVAQAMPLDDRRPERLVALDHEWGDSLRRLRDQRPSLVFAVLGQARAIGTLTPERERELVGALLNHWALRSTLELSEASAAAPRPPQKSSPNGNQRMSPVPT